MHRYPAFPSLANSRFKPLREPKACVTRRITSMRPNRIPSAVIDRRCLKTCSVESNFDRDHEPLQSLPPSQASVNRSPDSNNGWRLPAHRSCTSTDRSFPARRLALCPRDAREEPQRHMIRRADVPRLYSSSIAFSAAKGSSAGWVTSSSESGERAVAICQASIDCWSGRNLAHTLNQRQGLQLLAEFLGSVA